MSVSLNSEHFLVGHGKSPNNKMAACGSFLVPTQLCIWPARKLGVITPGRRVLPNASFLND
jgi:hypothetical protein